MNMTIEDTSEKQSARMLPPITLHDLIMDLFNPAPANPPERQQTPPSERKKKGANRGVSSIPTAKVIAPR